MEIYQRVSQGLDGAEPAVNRILESASHVVGRCKETAGDVEQAEGCKGRQIQKLKEFATLNNLWIDFSCLPIIYIDKGGENEVFYDGHSSVIKLNNFEYAGDDLTNFFIRIFVHNEVFSNVPYALVGFTENSMHEFCAVLTQPDVQAEREATAEEIIRYMESLGFVTDYPDEFHNDKYVIFDAVPNNVLYGKDGNLYFIDTQIRLR
ncbi:hypothetical protein Barb7_00725 [Bacteroidales bacterium Barb7]|nr:hypothetical protein Barb7_00725 [Bacteroidales bacterium Barb7]